MLDNHPETRNQEINVSVHLSDPAMMDACFGMRRGLTKQQQKRGSFSLSQHRTTSTTKRIFEVQTNCARVTLRSNHLEK